MHLFILLILLNEQPFDCPKPISSISGNKNSIRGEKNKNEKPAFQPKKHRPFYFPLRAIFLSYLADVSYNPPERDTEANRYVWTRPGFGAASNRVEIRPFPLLAVDSSVVTGNTISRVYKKHVFYMFI